MDRLSKYQILAIDRQPEHVETIGETLAQGNIDSEVVAIADLNDALAYLKQQGAYHQAPRPHLILIDINESPANSVQPSLEFLNSVKSDPGLKQIPIIVLTMIDASAIVYQSYSLQGNCYVLKPSNLDQLAATIRRIEEFWLGIVTLPR